MMRMMTCVMCVCMLAMSVSAATIYVPDDYASIGTAIGAAADLDEIVVRAGVYTGANNRNLSFSKNIVLRSESGALATAIDAEGLDRVFKIQGAPATAKVKGFTIRNGFNDVLLSSGGGGAGVCLTQTAITIEDCIIRNCVGVEGAGMLIRNSTGTRIVNCTFQNNTGEHDYKACLGAGVSLYLSSGVEFSGCQFISNRNQPVGNSGNGGAIYMYRYDAAFRNCVFEGNDTRNSGGVAFVNEGDLTFDQCTFYGNSSSGNGGCFWIGYMGGGPEVICTNSIFRSNSAGGDGNVAFVTGVGTVGGTFRYGYCDVNPSGIAHAALGGWTIQNLGGNINVDPLFASVGYDNGSTWVPGDYHLKSMVGRYYPLKNAWLVDAVHSPCIDAGDPADDYSAEPVPNGERVNMGAYGATDEASKSPYCSTPIAADLTGDCRVDIEDFAELAAAWLSCNMVPAEFCW